MQYTLTKCQLRFDRKLGTQPCAHVFQMVNCVFVLEGGGGGLNQMIRVMRHVMTQSVTLI
jgi:hypothetical protein